MKSKNVVINMICLIFMFHFFSESVYKLSDIEWFRIWLRSMPYLRPMAQFLRYGIPIWELCVAILLVIPPIRLIAFYITFWSLVLYLIYLMWIFLVGVVFILPYHIYWSKPSWLQVIFFNILLAAISFGVIVIMEKKSSTKKIPKILRNQPAEVH